MEPIENLPRALTAFAAASVLIRLRDADQLPLPPRWVKTSPPVGVDGEAFAVLTGATPRLLESAALLGFTHGAARLHFEVLGGEPSVAADATPVRSSFTEILGVIARGVPRAVTVLDVDDHVGYLLVPREHLADVPDPVLARLNIALTDVDAREGVDVNARRDLARTRVAWRTPHAILLSMGAHRALARIEAPPASAPPEAALLARALTGARDVVLGAPLPPEREHEERLPKRHALATIGADSIASSIYGPESMLRSLMVAGGVGALPHSGGLTLAILALLFLVASSYLQTIGAYPGGGGSYTVSKANLGPRIGLVAGVALMIDYILNVAVSVAAGVMSLTSIVPGLTEHRVALGLSFVALLTLGNLRGTRSSSWLFSTPVYLYLASCFGLIGYGLLQWSQGALPRYVPTPDEVQAIGSAGLAIGAFALLRAFASGAVALSGVEAISNGVPAFRRPEPRNAKVTLAWMTGVFALLFAGLTFLGAQTEVVPDPAEIETIVSRIARTILGAGPLLVIVQASAAIMLAVAANTSYADFPRLANVMAQDGFLPGLFSRRGHRLTYGHGILVLSLIAAILLIGFGGSLANLTPLFTIGVFISFTMSEVGMVIHHWRRRGPNWLVGFVLNGSAALVTGGVALLEAVTKFTEGAWMVLLLIPAATAALGGVRQLLARGARKLAGRA